MADDKKPRGVTGERRGDGPIGTILRRQHPDSRYTGLRGTARLIGGAVLDKIKGTSDERGRGQAGEAARDIGGRQRQIDSATEDANRGNRQTRTRRGGANELHNRIRDIDREYS